ncbi:hypothetical protein CLAFUW4_04589 [Fulvia fulva]|uniref:Uncharacterized protein n=1 Tax=Passalora fulva TaxID=5499 RepID=A0A9Q8LEY8_PASFU|nr:uncharacterized protein CLAFUR5_04551 [Fulvia fulva]KAK4627214.1 hypothetical protein CLAFUR4_04575 [Fulvia fulva]UJO16165.1 hypothetical protein CLAFUR5_04551 [Fulvia fulva]WPV14357.1 hypothetical protein CLAFUW4_04589 [Fulvia fulva]WPV28459.1 hypothetical protein CLAFUW7_04581 [Fulvia fulva]
MMDTVECLSSMPELHTGLLPFARVVMGTLGGRYMYQRNSQLRFSSVHQSPRLRSPGSYTMTMAAIQSLLILSLTAFASANPRPRVNARQDGGDFCAGFITDCLSTATATTTPAYLTQLCGAATSLSLATRTITRQPRTTTTITVPRSTVYSPSATETITSTSTIGATTTVTSNVTVTAGTSPVHLNTTTISITRTSYDYTCSGTDGPVASPPTTSEPATTGVVTVVRRQNQAPNCVATYRTECGNAVIRTACSSLGFTSVSTRTVTRTSTVFTGTTSTATRSITRGVSIVNNATTITEISTSSQLRSSTEVVTITVPATPGVISTATVFTTTTITTATSVPSSFRILIRNTTTGATRAVGSRVIDGGWALAVPGDNTNGDSFTIDPVGPGNNPTGPNNTHLVDLSTLRAVAVKYNVNVRPYLLLFAARDDLVNNGAVTVPSFSACNGRLFADVPGGARSVFGVCDGVLSLGDDGARGLAGCEIVVPELDPASVNITTSASPTGPTTEVPTALPTDTIASSTTTDTTTTPADTTTSSSSSSTSETTIPTAEPTAPVGDGDGNGDVTTPTTPPIGDDVPTDNGGDTTTRGVTPPV